MTRILLVEDDRNLGESLVTYLRDQGFEVTLARTAAEARCSLGSAPAVVVLDWMLPDAQGLDILRELRCSGNHVPVIFLTARGELVDRVVGLEAGANDYMVKPFEPRELVARIRVQLRPSGSPSQAPERLSAAGITLDCQGCTAELRGRPVSLSRMEFLLLKLFLENQERVLSREEILTRVWGYDRSPSTRTVDTHVLQLRQKFGDALFETVRGFGYRFRSHEELTDS